MCLRESTFHHLPCLPSPYHSVCSRLYWWVQLRAPDINGRINWVCISNVLQQTTCERETETEIDHQLPTAPSQFINQEMRSSVLSSSKISFPNRKWKMQPANVSENFPPTAQSTSLFPASRERLVHPFMALGTTPLWEAYSSQVYPSGFQSRAGWQAGSVQISIGNYQPVMQRQSEVNSRWPRCTCV